MPQEDVLCHEPEPVRLHLLQEILSRDLHADRRAYRQLVLVKVNHDHLSARLDLYPS